MPCPSIWRRWTGSGRAPITAASLPPSSPRAKSIFPGRSTAISLAWKRKSALRLRPRSSCVGGLSPLSAFGLSLDAFSRTGHDFARDANQGWSKAFRTFHAFHLPGRRTDPRPAAAGGLDRGAGAGGAVADSCRCCSIAARPAILPPCWRSAGNIRSAPISARRWRSGSPTSPFAPPATTCSASICWRSFAAVVTFWTFYQLGARHRRRPAGGARGAADDDGRGVLFARPRIRSAGPGAPALGAAAAAFLAD